MADDRWLSWQAEQAGTNRLPPISLVFFVFGALALFLISMLGGYDRVSEHANRGRPPTLCQEHAGRPGWSSVCGGRNTPPPPAKP